ncbi:MAG: VIT and vWA domain-containing protein, partial [Armatimonadaceae bacterium]
MALESIQVSTDVKAGVASSKVELLLRNPSDQPREGDLLLPIPEGAAVRDFAAYDGERRLESEILDKDNARRLYEEIVRQRRDPALLEFEGLEAVRMRVFPIEPRSTRKLTLRLTHALPRVGASWRLEFRFRGPHLPEAERVRWDISLSQIPHVYSPTHAVEVQQREVGRTTVRFDAKVGDTALAESPSVVVLATEAKDEALALALSTYRVGDSDGTFVLVASPGRPAPARSQASPRKWVLVMDRSGSMSGRKIEQARGALLAALEQLRPVDQFQLISFSDKAERAFDTPKPASAANVTAARRWVDDLTADGGTNIDAALRSGLESFDRDHKAAVLFFTDGRPTVGQRDTRTLVAEAVKRAGSRTRVFVFGVGYDVDVPFLDQLAGRLRGDADYVRPDEDIEVKTARFLARSGDPLLANPVLRMEGVSVRDMTPSLEQLPDLYEGVPWLVAGRYRGPVPKGRLILEGETPDGPKRFVLEAAFPERSSESDWVPQLWAARRIGELLDQIRLSDPDDP